MIISLPPFLEKKRASFDVGALVSACLLSLLFCFGCYIRSVVYEQKPIYAGIAGKTGLFATCVILSILLYAAISIVYRCYDAVPRSYRHNTSGEQGGHLARAQSTSEPKSFSDFTKESFSKIALLLLLAWIPLLIIRFPGNLDPDSLWQIMEPRGLVEWSDHHPWFDTILFYLFWSIGDLASNHAISLLLYSIFQSVLTSAVLSLSLVYMRYCKVPSAFIKCSLIFYAFFPVIPLFSQAMMKDSLFAVFWIPFLLLYIEIVRTGGRSLNNVHFCIAFSVVCLLMMLTKKTGLYLIVLSVIPLLFIMKSFRLRFLCSLGTPILLFSVLWSQILLPSWGVKEGSSAEMMSIPSQQVAYYLRSYPEEMTEEDWEILEGVYRHPQALAEAYKPGRADATKVYWDNDSTTTERMNFFLWYLSKLLDHPKCFIISAAANMLPLYYPDTDTQQDESLLFYRDNLASSETGDPSLENALLGYSGWQANQTDIDSLMSGAYRTSFIARLSDAFDAALLSLMSTFPVLFSKMLYATAIPLIIAVYIISRSKRHPISLISLAPAFISLLSLMAGPIALPRYLAASVYCAPIICSLPYLKRKEIRHGSTNNIETPREAHHRVMKPH